MEDKDNHGAAVEDKGNRGTTTITDGSQSQDLWERAYEALENRDPLLVAAYACHLDPARNSSTAPTRWVLSPKLIEAVIEKKLLDNEAKKLVFRVGTESIKVQEQGEKIIRFIIWSNDFISAAVSAQPYAALAWSGVSILLPLLLNSSKQKEAMLIGLNSITDLLRLYEIREKLYLQDVDQPGHPDFVKAIVQLYTDILEYQATLIYYLSLSSVKRGIQSTFKRNDWNGMLEKVQSSNARCAEYAALFDQEKEHRFYTKQSSQIEQSTEVQKRMFEMFEAFQDSRQQDRRDDKEAELLRTLASDYKGDKDSISIRVPGTCEWVFEDKRFLEWRDNKKSSLLWISGGPGCGKSVLSRCLIDEKRLCTNVMTSTVCYFFFKDGQEQRSKGSNALSAILHQFFKNKSGSSLLTHALSSYKNFGEKLQDTFSELWDILIKSVKDPDAGEIVCVFDALDECKDNARKQLVEKIVGFFSRTDHSENPSTTLKFLITSRPYEDLELAFEPISSVDTFTRFDSDEKSEKIGQEIHLVIDAKMPYIARHFSAEDCKSISERLKRLDNRTYLWLFLTMDIIERSRSKYSKMSSIHKLLSTLPSSVSDAYEKILSRSSDKDTAKILLQIVIAARRPLTLEEANIALTIATQNESYKSHESLELWPSTAFQSTIQNMCGLFISVYESKIFLIHQTAREFLIGSKKSHATSSREWEGSLNMTTAHGTMSQICLQYLNLQEFTIVPQEQPYQNRNIQKIREAHLFIDYAAHEWHVHYNSQDTELAKGSRKAAGMLCRTSRAQLSYWYSICFSGIDFVTPPPDYVTGLGFASRFGLLYVVDDFLSEGADVNAVNGEDGTALILASSEGHEKIVEMLLNHNADIDAKSGISDTALVEAAAKGHEKIVEMLLHRKADINAESGNYGTALIAAVATGHEKIVEMLFNQNADVNARSEIYGTALIAAAMNGHKIIFEMLLNQKADIHAKAGDYGTALIVAASNGHKDIFEMLLNQKADINARSERYGTALIAAAARGHERIVEMLLNQNPDVNARSERYGTALIAAAAEGHKTIFEMLLNQEADINAESERYGTALIAAAAEGHEKIVDILLDWNATTGKDIALERASAAGREKVIEILLKRNQDIDFKGKIYCNAVKKASCNVHLGSVEMLNKMMDSNEVEAYGNALEVALKAATGAAGLVDDDDDNDDNDDNDWKDWPVNNHDAMRAMLNE